MKRFIFLQSEVYLFKQHIISSVLRHFKIHLFEHKIKVPYLCPISKISSFSLLQKDQKTLENKSNEKKVKKIKEISYSKAAQSSGEKKKNKEKIMTMSPEINYNDFLVKFKKLQKFLEKGMMVTVKIENSKNVEEDTAKIFNSLQECMAKQKISAKISKTGPTIHFSPIVVNEEQSQKSQNKTSSSDSTSESKNES